MLDDVLIELGQILQVDPALLGERFGLKHAAAQQLHDHRQHEYHRAQNSCWRELRTARDALQIGESLLAENAQCREGRKKESSLGANEKRQSAHGDHQ